MKRLVVVLVALILSCSPLLAERIVKVEAISTDTTTFRENRIKLNMAELAAQLVPFQSAVDLTPYALLAGDADGQTIQGIAGEGGARIDIAETDSRTVSIYGSGATPGVLYADDGGAGLYSPGQDSGLYAEAGVFGIFTSGFLSLQTGSCPTTASDTGTAGDICFDSGFIYYCTATNTWVRVAMATW